MGENLEAAANEESKINDDLYRLQALIAIRDPQGTKPQLEKMQV